VNAQLSVLKGLEAAKRHGYIFVVPPMIQWWAEKDPSYLLILPFGHFHDQQHFHKFADDYGRRANSLSLHVQLPPSVLGAWSLQQPASRTQGYGLHALPICSIRLSSSVRIGTAISAAAWSTIVWGIHRKI